MSIAYVFTHRKLSDLSIGAFDKQPYCGQGEFYATKDECDI